MTIDTESTSTLSGDASLGPATDAPTTANDTATNRVSHHVDPHEDADGYEPKEISAGDQAILEATTANPLAGDARDPEGLRQACRAARICDEFRGEDILVLDLTGITPLFDYFVIATGSSRRQMHAIAEEVDRMLKGEGSRRRGIEGYDQSFWIVEDYGDVVLHVFTDESRETYDIEGLWADAPRVNWQSVLEAADATAEATGA